MNHLTASRHLCPLRRLLRSVARVIVRVLRQKWDALKHCVPGGGVNNCLCNKQHLKLSTFGFCRLRYVVVVEIYWATEFIEVKNLPNAPLISI